MLLLAYFYQHTLLIYSHQHKRRLQNDSCFLILSFKNTFIKTLLQNIFINILLLTYPYQHTSINIFFLAYPFNILLLTYPYKIILSKYSYLSKFVFQSIFKIISNETEMMIKIINDCFQINEHQLNQIKMLQEDKMKIFLASARDNIAFFPIDLRGDIYITFKNKQFKLQKAYLRLDSQFFKKQDRQKLTIEETFDELKFQKMMSCFYGGIIKCTKVAALDYFAIAKFLGTPEILELIRNDICKSIDTYPLLKMLQFAHKNLEHQIFSACIAEFVRFKFVQLRQNKLQLLFLDQQLFKIIIHLNNHNLYTEQTQISALEIDELIFKYAERNKYNSEQYLQIKFQLLNKRFLNSQEYKQIFYDKSRSNFHSASQLLKTDIYSNELRNDIEITYQKKKNEALEVENKYYCNQIEQFHLMIIQNKKVSDQLNQTVFNLQKQLQKKEQSTKIQQKKINQLYQKMQKNQQEINKLKDTINSYKSDKNSQINQLNFSKNNNQIAQSIFIYKNGVNNQFIKNQSGNASSKHQTVQSVYVDNNGVNSLFMKNEGVNASSKNSISKNVSNQQFEKSNYRSNELNSNRSFTLSNASMKSRKRQEKISFDVKPSTVPLELYYRLAQLLPTEGFQCKKFTLLVRFSEQESKGSANALFNKSGLLLLVRNGTNIFGGYTRAQYTKYVHEGSIKDESAFIFNLTQSAKFKVKAGGDKKPMFVGRNYLMCFGQDLMIQREPLKERSSCHWPKYYEKGNLKQTAEWFVGSEKNSFLPTEVEVYQVNHEHLEISMNVD